jgi:hypothetical protein
MLKKRFTLAELAYILNGVAIPMIFAYMFDPSKLVAAGCVAYCGISAWFYASSRWIEGFEAGIGFQLAANELVPHPDDHCAETADKDAEAA